MVGNVRMQSFRNVWSWILTPSLRSFTRSTTTNSRGSIFVFNLSKISAVARPQPLQALPFREGLLLDRDPLLLLRKRHLRQGLLMRRFNGLQSVICWQAAGLEPLLPSKGARVRIRIAAFCTVRELFGSNCFSLRG